MCTCTSWYKIPRAVTVWPWYRLQHCCIDGAPEVCWDRFIFQSNLLCFDLRCCFLLFPVNSKKHYQHDYDKEIINMLLSNYSDFDYESVTLCCRCNIWKQFEWRCWTDVVDSDRCCICDMKVVAVEDQFQIQFRCSFPTVSVTVKRNKCCCNCLL